jgi:hypothetical protein
MSPPTLLILPPPLRSGEERAYTHQQAMIIIAPRSKPRHLSALAGALPAHRRGPIKAGRHPHPVRWWRSATMAGPLAPRALVVVILPSHHKQRNGASFKTKSKEGRCRFDSLKIERAELEDRCFLPRYLYYRETEVKQCDNRS